jgi:hypothetical protein
MLLDQEINFSTGLTCGSASKSDLKEPPITGAKPKSVSAVMSLWDGPCSRQAHE